MDIMNKEKFYFWGCNMNITNNIFSQINIDKKETGDIFERAAELAKFHHWLGLKKTGNSLLPKLREYSSFIKESYADINEYYYKTDDVIPAAEWYLDNYYLINELVNDLFKDLSKQCESKLTYLAGGDLAGLPRVYLLIQEYEKNTSNQLDFIQLRKFITQYQTESPLSSAEIWAIPIILKVIMVEKIFYQVERIIYIQKERALAENWLSSILGHSGKEINLSEQDLDTSKSFSTVFIERVARRLKEYGTDAKLLLNWLDNVANKQNMTVEKVISTEQYYLSSHGVLMGSIITAIKQVNSENWSEFFERVSLVQQVLEGDPAGVFTQMDFDSRDKYRHEIETLSHQFNVSEITVAKTIEKMANTSTETPQNHVGYYLFGKGRLLLEKELTTNWGKVKETFNNIVCLYKHKPTFSYLGVIFLLTLLAFSLFIASTQREIAETSFGGYLFLILASFLLINGIAVYLCNRGFCKILPASFLPKLDFSNGIPSENKTVVVIPAIFNSPEKVTEQLSQLEIHYLCNRDQNLYFAILGDFSDAPNQSMPDDEKIITAGVNGVRKLNRKYGENKFFYFHRSRQWNEKEKVWMGWERKRGKILEFNKMVLDDGETSFYVKSLELDPLKDVRYIITLDADTMLPRDSAYKLIGILAHPLQRAKMDDSERKVVSGYGIIQPRIGITPASAFATPFATIFTGTAGLDPYTCAISDIYQDLFGEGIFTGKGIYDLKVFHAVTKDTFPENSILSHDLIEGIHVRTGLATDIVLFDGYPSKFLASTKRTHRWIRGDWQIVRYIFNKNISVISRWKIIDNLRRSLEVPLQFLLLFLAFTYFHGMFNLILGLLLFSFGTPLILNLAERIVDRSITYRIAKYELRLGLSQILFSLIVLPYQAYIQVDAIIRSLARQFITKKSLLEWETAADSERQLGLDLKSFYTIMAPGIIVSLLLMAGYYFVNPLNGFILTVLILLWVCSPYIAFKLSIPYALTQKEIALEDRIELRKWSRQVWAFFDIFVNKKNNYLPPDNIQLEPYKGVAARTSPTNIGLALLSNLAAEDFGYITKKNMLKKIRNTLNTIRKMPKWHGHIYNWYNTENLEPLYPIYISTVDNGNFATYLITLKNGLSELVKRPIIERSILSGLEDTFRLIDKNHLEGFSLAVEFESELKEINKDSNEFDLAQTYSFILKWDERLSDLKHDIEEIKDKNLNAYDVKFWSYNLSMMLKDYKNSIELYYPFLSLENYPELLKDCYKCNLKSLVRLYLNLLRAKQGELTAEVIPFIKKGLKHAVITLLWSSRLSRQLNILAYGMNFKPLFDPQKRLFSIGYNLTEQKLDGSYYDLLASEARQTSLFAIAKGDIPEAHWFKMARPLTRIDGNRCLVAWSGTMFEFLMPLILFKNYRGTLMDETYKSVVKIQQSYAKKGEAPWGISESGFFSFDIQTNYQYKAFGVPGLGLKRGLSKDMVISPYSTFMALAVDFQSSMENLKLMKQKEFNGIYGLYEAIDFTKTRVPYNEEFSVVKSYMSHHQGMSFISLNNILNGNIMQRRFHNEPTIKSIELLLQEQVPLKEYTFNPIMEEVKEEKIPAISRKKAEKPVIYQNPDTRMPRTCFISNREYSVMMTLSGSGYSQYNDIHITRWREDPTLDMYGTFIYIQNLNSGEVWSTSSKPLNKSGDDYQVTCFPNTMRFSRKDGNLFTQTEIFVSPEDPVEVRKVSITNQSQHSRDIQLTSYFEVVLDQLKADMAHPTFSKLFIQTRYENSSLIAFRRPRHHDKKKIYLMHTSFVEGDVIGETEYETDRTKFIGRGRTLANPKAMDFNQPLSNSVGAVLDPIMSIRNTVRINAGKTIVVYYLVGIGESKEKVLLLAEKYKNKDVISLAKELSWSQNLMELTNLDLSFEEANLISSLASQVIYPGPIRRGLGIKNNRKGQSSLWAYGISGDLPIILLKIQDNNQIKLIEQMLRIHEYWKIKGLFIDLVILNEDKTGYFQTIQELIHERVGISHARKLVNKPGGVFLLKQDQLNVEIVLLLNTVARMIFTGENGSLYNQIYKYVRLAERPALLLEEDDRKLNQTLNAESKTVTDSDTKFMVTINKLKETLLFFNGYGGFSPDGKEYVIVNGENLTPLPWINVIANSRFGTIITESGSSYSYSQNSREYKLSPWSNDPLLDTSGEAIFIKDEGTKEYWSPLPQPKGAGSYVIRHGQGYSVFEHMSNGFNQETTVYVPMDHSLKVIRLKLKNTTNITKVLSAYYYIEWVLGVNKEVNAPYLVTEMQNEIILCRNVYLEEFTDRVAFLTTFGGNFKSYTADRKDFIGTNRSLKEPIGLGNDRLSEKVGSALDPCAVIQSEIVIKPNEERVIYFIVGDAENQNRAISLAKSLQDEKKLVHSYQEVLKFWDDLLSTIQIQTPEKSLDLLINRWLIYQTLVCRIWARSAFYQSGGAFGFRDQLQDVMSLSILKPELTRKQILLHSSRQFPEGDVQHWWHAEKGKGIRTKFSDDLLWLPYVTADYIEHTKDFSVLDEKTPFLRQDILGPEEDERYAIPEVSDDWANVYEHCVRAIDRSLKFGEHGLPLIGTGDWNDGFSAIGREGKGESIWLGWFLIDTLKRFLSICRHRGDLERTERYQETIDTLIINMEKNAWDGSWYRRAYYDDGTPLGSSTNTECQIDSLAQSWAVISESAKESRVADAMLALERYLWDKENLILKLFTPPFDKTEKNPGYIKGYIPGVRENGGQYTHGAIWAILAYAKLGKQDKALELFNMLNPVNHARTNTEVSKYKVEPYVMTADIYSVYPNVGRGGWSWYTGAAGWMYQAAIEGILGLTIKGDELTFTPCVPRHWQEYRIQYHYKTSIYDIKINLQSDMKILVDDIEHDHFPIMLKDDGLNHKIEIFIR